MWEFISGIPPFDDRAYDLQLSISICKGERPKIIENIPQCYIDLMKRCWDEDPLKRPKSSEISKIINDWYEIISNTNIHDKNISNEVANNIMEFYKADKALKQKQTNLLTIKSYPRECRTSRLLDFIKLINQEVVYLSLDQEDEKKVLPRTECLDYVIVNSK